jgi:hypothetical protein
VHRAQGLTCDTAQALLSDATAREELYVAASRARHTTHLYLTEPDADYDAQPGVTSRTHAGAAPAERLAAIIGRTHAEPSATELTDPRRDGSRQARPVPRHTAPTAPTPAAGAPQQRPGRASTARRPEQQQLHHRTGERRQFAGH